MRYIIDLPDNITLGDITAAKGAIIEASTGYIDWDRLSDEPRGESDHAISAPGRILLAVAHQLGKDLPAPPPERPEPDSLRSRPRIPTRGHR